VRVVIADDSVLLREGLSRVLTDGGFEVVAQAANADELRQAVRRFKPPCEADAVRPADDAEVPLVRLALAGWAGYLRAYRGPLTASLAEAYKLPPAEANARLDRLLDGLDLFDAVELTQRTAPGRATLTLRLKALPGEPGASATGAVPGEGTKKPH